METQVLNPPRMTYSELLRAAKAEEQRQQEEAAQRAQAQAAEQAAHRKSQGEHLSKQVGEAIEKYEELRAQLHKAVGVLFQSNLAYAQLTGADHPKYPESSVMRIDLPGVAKPGWDSGFTSTRAAASNFFNTKRWE